VDSSKTTADTSAIRSRATNYHRPKDGTRYFKRYVGATQLDIRVHNNTHVNLERGLAERVFNVPIDGGGFGAPPRPQAGAFASLRRYRRQICDPRALGDWRGIPLTREEFVASCTQAKKKTYENARRSLYQAPVTQCDAILKTFVKAEKINFTAKPDPAPRVIQPRDPRYNLEVGRFLRPLEKLLYSRIADMWGAPTIMKGMNGFEAARVLRRKWDRFAQPVAVSIDANRFDQHVSVEALRYEHSIYTGCYPLERETLGTLLSWQIRNQGKTCSSDRVSVQYTKFGSRMSGDMNTSLGNCVLMCIITLALRDHLGIGMELANNGDDCVLIVEQRDLAKLVAAIYPWYLRFGFTMKVEDPVYTFEHVVFCQAQPVFNGQEWVMVRQYPLCVGKDSTITEDCDADMSAVWRWCVGSGGISLYGDMPILGAFYRQMKLGGRPGRSEIYARSGFSYLADGCAERGSMVSEDARFSFYLAFGVLPYDQVMLEEATPAFTDDRLWLGASHVGLFGRHDLAMGPR
jgi:hypothetical protein